jgi:hypothetical protein
MKGLELGVGEPTMIMAVDEFIKHGYVVLLFTWSVRVYLEVAVESCGCDHGDALLVENVTELLLGCREIECVNHVKLDSFLSKQNHKRGEHHQKHSIYTTTLALAACSAFIYSSLYRHRQHLHHRHLHHHHPISVSTEGINSF